MASASHDHPKLRHEIIAPFTFFLVIFLVLCLVSYSLELFGDNIVLQGPAENWCGSAGFYTSHYLFRFLGLSVFIPVLGLFLLFGAVFFPGSLVGRMRYLLPGMIGLIVSASGLLATAEQLVFPAEFITPGGDLGFFVLTSLGRFIGPVGSILGLVLLLIFSLMAILRFSIFSAFIGMWLRGGALIAKLSSKISSKSIAWINSWQRKAASKKRAVAEKQVVAERQSTLARLRVAARETIQKTIEKKQPPSAVSEPPKPPKSAAQDGSAEVDEKYAEAVAAVCETGNASASMLQRRLRVGYNRASGLIEAMEDEGIIGPAEGLRPREVLVRTNYSD